MARIVSVRAGHQDVRPHHSDVDCFVQELRGENGEKLVHISTFGSAQRQAAPKSSQSMQFDLATASALIEQFVAVFGSDVVRHR